MNYREPDCNSQWVSRCSYHTSSCHGAVSPSDKLRAERDVWEGAAYGLAGQVTRGTTQLRTLRRLQLGEKLWAQLARHFTIVLSRRDTKQLGEVNRYVREWREGVIVMSRELGELEREMKNKVRR